MKAWIAGALALSLLLIGAGPVAAQAPGQADIYAPDSGGTTTIDATAYTGRPEAMNCLDMGSQANAQSVLRADPKDPLQLDSDRNGIACEANAEPKDMNPVPR